MTLSNTVFFPHAMLPLYIFEPRYRQMLEEALQGDRLFVVAREDVLRGQSTGEFEPPFPVATVGVIRASHQEDDGCSHLILQGLARVKFSRIVREQPYRLGEFEALSSIGGGDDTLSDMRSQLADAVRSRQCLATEEPAEIYDFLDDLADPETYLDLVSFTLCDDSDTKQQLLETLDTRRRYRRLLDYLQRTNDQLRLEKQLRGNLKEDRLDRN